MTTASIDTRATQAVNIRHDIDPILLKAQISKCIAKHEGWRVVLKQKAQDNVQSYETAKLAGKHGSWPRPPEGPHYVDPLIDGLIALELDNYSLVRVIELPKEGKRFVLVYGNHIDSEVSQGTGPFESVQEASAWFLNGGR